MKYKSEWKVRRENKIIEEFGIMVLIILNFAIIINLMIPAILGYLIK